MTTSMVFTFIIIGFILFILFMFAKTIKIVSQNEAFIVERLGRYNRTLLAGFHILIPFIDQVRYIHTLKEQAIDVPAQVCITNDNIAVEVDGILYLRVLDPKSASYGIDNYLFASIQIAQTTMRSVIGRLPLDKTFEERETINVDIIGAVDKASDPWGIKVTRYEVKNITPPQSIKDSMEKQMRAEREKRAAIAESEGERQAVMNRADGDKQELIARSEGEKSKIINEAEGRAQQILSIANATAEGIKAIASAINTPGGQDALKLRVAEQYIDAFAKLAKTNNTTIIPTNMADVSSVISTAMNVLKSSETTGSTDIKN